MATGPDWSCPICREALEDVAYVTSCNHQFCLGCIVRWARRNPSCPLCRRPVNALIYSVQPNREVPGMALPEPSGALAAVPRAEQGAAQPLPMAYVASFPPKTWALFFRNYAEILEPVQLWLNDVLLAPCWWDVAFAQGRIISCLCRYGLDEELLVRELQPLLHEQTVTFVHQLFGVALEQCCERIQRLVDEHSSRAAEAQGGAAGDAAPEGEAASGAGTQEQPRHHQECVGEDASSTSQSGSPKQDQEPLR